MPEPIRVLIIEDSETDALLMIRELDRNGFEVTFKRVFCAPDLEISLKQTWDIILSDYNMPGFSGTEALQIAQTVQPDLPFVLVSGVVSEDIAAEVMKAGARDYI
jgi:CheY-like chemotaxis protein